MSDLIEKPDNRFSYDAAQIIILCFYGNCHPPADKSGDFFVDIWPYISFSIVTVFNTFNGLRRGSNVILGLDQ